MYNLDYLINVKTKTINFYISLAALLLVMFLIVNIKFYNSVDITGVVDDGWLSLYVFPENVSVITSADKINFFNEEVKIKEKQISEPLFDQSNQTNYQIVRLKTNRIFVENEIVELKFLYNKTSIFKKTIEKLK